MSETAQEKLIRQTVARQRAFFRTGATRPVAVRLAALQKLKAEIKAREPQLLAALMLFKKHPWAYRATLACGIILMLWIVLEWYVWGFVALSNIYFVLGLIEAVAAFYCIRKKE